MGVENLVVQGQQNQEGQEAEIIQPQFCPNCEQEIPLKRLEAFEKHQRKGLWCVGCLSAKEKKAAEEKAKQKQTRDWQHLSGLA